MLHYPKIPPATHCPGGRCIAFEKIDGTNLHFAWDRDFGWHAFGTRRDEFNLDEPGIALFERTHPELAGSPASFLASLAEPVARVLRDDPVAGGRQQYTLFTEYAGPCSFAGRHRQGDDMRLYLIDVRVEGHGFLGPEQFVASFGHLNIPRVVYRGKFRGQLTEDVRQGKYPVNEGVVVKGGHGGEDVWMVKIKTKDYLERLQRSFAENWQDYWE